MSSAAEYREMAATLEGRWMEADATQAAAMLREAAELRAWLQLIYDFDDGAWAAGRSREAARKQGIETMRNMAGRALRGEPVGGTDE